MVASAEIKSQTVMMKEHKAGQKAEEVKLEGAELMDAIRKQVEYYMSKENLTQDQFLVSKMDKEFFVELSVIADFHLLKVLTANEANEKLIIEAIKPSRKVVMDEACTKVRPSNINARTTLILRNIPTATAEADVTSFLEKAGLKSSEIVSIKSDIGDNWFATFETEDAAKNALDMVKEKHLKWESKPVGCALKSENLMKGITPGAAPSGGPGMGPIPNFYNVPMQYQNNYGYGYQGEGQGGYRNSNRGGHGGRRGPGGPEAVKDGHDGHDSHRRGPKKGKGRSGRGENGGSRNDDSAQQPPINLSDFPSLAPVKVPTPSEEGPSSDAEKDNNKDPHGNDERQPNGPVSSSDPSSSESTSENGSTKEDPQMLTTNHAPIKKKLSYAQMAQMVKSEN